MKSILPALDIGINYKEKLTEIHNLIFVWCCFKNQVVPKQHYIYIMALNAGLLYKKCLKTFLVVDKLG